MTIHKSKGLEFPVVFVPALDARSKGDTDMLRFNADAGLGIKVDMGGELQDTSVMLAIKDIEKQLDSAEKQRQLYVAMTRAQDRLILSGTYDSSSKSRSENWFSSLRNILQDYDQFLLKEYEAGKKGTAVKSAADLEQVLVTDELLQRIKPLPEYGLEWQRSLSATALQTYLDCPRCYYYQYILQMPGYEAVNAADASGYLPAALQGTVIHKALELLTNGYEQANRLSGQRCRHIRYREVLQGHTICICSILMDRFIKGCRKLNVRLRSALSCRCCRNMGLLLCSAVILTVLFLTVTGLCRSSTIKQACRRQQANLRRVIFISWHCIKRQRQNYGSARQHWPNCIFYKIIPAGSCRIAVIGCRKLPNYAEIFFRNAEKVNLL